ncbi:MAG: diguanylate cyclase domain-containing protein [Salinibacter sp.]
MAPNPDALSIDVDTLNLLLTSVDDVLSILGDEGEILYVSPSIGDVLGHEPGERIGESIFELVHPEDEGKARRLFEQALETPKQTRRVRIRMRHKQGAWRTHEIRGRGGRTDETRQAVVQISRDVTVQKEEEGQQFGFQALHDSLTQLPNRQLFEDRLQKALARADRMETGCAVLYMDLNEFEQVNDTFGRPAGARMLRQLSRRLQRVVRDEDTVARLASDEFLVLVDRIEAPGQVERVAERVTDTVETPFELQDSTVSITVAIGAALSDGARAPSSLLEGADEAMYEAKQKKPDSAFQLYEAAAGE